MELDLCGGESYEAWKGCLDGLVARGLKAPLLCVIDGHAGLRRAVGDLVAWPGASDARHRRPRLARQLGPSPPEGCRSTDR